MNVWGTVFVEKHEHRFEGTLIKWTVWEISHEKFDHFEKAGHLFDQQLPSISVDPSTCLTTFGCAFFKIKCYVMVYTQVVAF